MEPSPETPPPPPPPPAETAPGEAASGGESEVRAPAPPQDEDAENANVEKPVEKPVDKPKEESSKMPKKKREKNPRFKDVEETGKWGEISKTEIYIAVGVVLVIIIGLAVGLGVAFSKKEPDEVVVVPAETKSPTAAPTLITANTQLDLIQLAVDSNEATAGLLDGLPPNVDYYKGLNVEGNSAQERAMSWILFEDTRTHSSEEVVLRWAFASIFYGMGGKDWTSAENWLSEEHVCEWEFIDCDPQTGLIREVDLSENNLTGAIPRELALVETLTAFTLRGNQVSGEIPGAVFGSLPRLTILNLDNNALTGTIPVELVDNGILNALFIQENQLTGRWPPKFCNQLGENFGLDCDKVTCSCCSGYNCYFEV